MTEEQPVGKSDRLMTECRKEFEEWCYRVGEDASRTGGNYDHQDVHRYWVGWRSCWHLHEATQKREMGVFTDKGIVPLSQVWQPIETAPKDGTPILVKYNYAQREKYITEAWWNEHTKSWHGNMLVSIRATNWMPLPDNQRRGRDNG